MVESRSPSLPDESEGATTLDDDEREGLIPDHISTHAELNEWEHTNIEKAELWAFSRRRSDVLNLSFVQELHRRMFDQTWTWAGQFRWSNKNLGVDKLDILVHVQNACADATYWVEHNVYALPEIAVRYHHRLVWVHPFANGTGRHARLSADVFLHSHGVDRLDWGADALNDSGQSRLDYLAALREADRDNFDPLLAYVRLH